MIRFPIASVVQMGIYYRAMVLSRQGHFEAARACLEPLANDSACESRARALQSIGVTHFKEGRLDDAGYFYTEAIRAARSKDVIAELCARFTLSAIRSKLGDHEGALADLRDAWPIITLAAQRQPFYFYVYHADVAYELGELGRLAEAKAACAVALACPFAPAYPEWSDTRDDLAQRSRSGRRSFVAVRGLPCGRTNSETSNLPHTRRRRATRLWYAPKIPYQRSDGRLSVPFFRNLRTVNTPKPPASSIEIRGPPSGSDK